MSILLADNFQYLGRKPLDSRMVCETIIDMINIPESTVYDGIIVYNKETEKFYTFKSTNEADLILEKWRELQTGGSNEGTGLVEIYTPSTMYKENQLLQFNNRLYIVLQDFTSSNTEIDDEANLQADIDANNLVAVDVEDKIDTHSVEYAQNQEYVKGNLIVFNNQLYIALQDFTSDDTETDIEDSLIIDITAGNLTNVNIDTGENAASADYEQGKSYIRNQFVVYDNKLYITTTSFTADTIETNLEDSFTSDFDAGYLELISLDPEDFQPKAPDVHIFNIANGGTGYTIGDYILVDNKYMVEVTAVDEDGAITHIIQPEEVNMPPATSASGINAEITSTPIYQVGYDGEWFNLPTPEISGDASLLEDITSNVTVGGADAGTLFAENTSFTDFAKMILRKQIIPSITFTASGSGLHEVGDTVNGSTLKVTINNIANVTVPINGVDFKMNGTIIDSPTIVEGQNMYQYISTDPIDENTTFSVTLTYDGTKVLNSSATIKFVNASYLGSINTLDPTEADIINLTKVVKDTKTYTWNNITLSDARFCYAYPASLGNLSSIKDANNFEYINSYTKKNITFSDGTEYNVYILTDPVTIANAKQIYA